MIEYFNTKEDPGRKYLFVSDIHGYNKTLATELLEIADSDNLPEIVFFLGDIIGNDYLDQLQPMFYNKIVNFSKKILPENPSDEQLLNFPTTEGETIADGCKAIWNLLHDIYPDFEPIVQTDYIRELTRYHHFGHFISNLPEEIRNIIKKDIQTNAEAMIEIMTKFTDKGCLVVITEGNWDARTPLDFYSTQECKAIPVEERSFYFKDLLKSLNKKIIYCDEVITIETNNEIFIIWPFDCAINTTSIPIFSNEETRKIVLVSHAQIDWKSVKGDIPMTGEGKKIDENMKIIINNLNPNFAIHGHLHDKIGNPIGYFYKDTSVVYLPKGECRFVDF